MICVRSVVLTVTLAYIGGAAASGVVDGVYAQARTPAESPLVVENIQFPSGPRAAVGHPFEVVVSMSARRAGVCTSTRWFVTDPDGTELDVNGKYPQTSCSSTPGQQLVRTYIWNPRTGPAGQKPWPTLSGRYQVRAEISQYTEGADALARGAAPRLAPAIIRSAEFVATLASPTANASSPIGSAAAADPIATTASQNLAAAYLSNSIVWSSSRASPAIPA